MDDRARRPAQGLEGTSAPGSSRRRERVASISLRTKSNSTCDEDGKPTSISLKPISTSVLNMRSLRSMSIGSINAWLPSRRPTLHQAGGRVSTASGQVPSRKWTGVKERYLVAGCFSMGERPLVEGDANGANKKRSPAASRLGHKLARRRAWR